VLMARAAAAYLISPPKDFLITPLPAIEFLVNAVPVGEQDVVRHASIGSVIGVLERARLRERGQLIGRGARSEPGERGEPNQARSGRF